LIIDLEKDRTKKYKSKLLVITDDFFLLDPQISKEDKDWLHPQMIKAIKKTSADCIILVFSPMMLSGLMNYTKFDERKKKRPVVTYRWKLV
jgi:hypothetical protein